jgi:hypothetical protein
MFLCIGYCIFIATLFVEMRLILHRQIYLNLVLSVNYVSLHIKF